MDRQQHTDSYYAASANPHPQHPELVGEIDCDVCVVGGGITGCSAALHLCERGYDTVLLEGARVGWGASGRSGGQVLAGFSAPMSTVRRLVGEADAGRLWALSCEAVTLLREQVSRHDIRCDLKSGHMEAALKPRQRQELIEWKEELEHRYAHTGLDMLEGDRLRSVLDSPRYVAGLFDPNNGHVHPLNYTLGLAGAARAAGTRVFEGSPVLRIESGERPVAHAANGKVRCRYLVLCGNAYLGDLQPWLRGRVMPVGTYIIATEPLGESRARSLIANDMAVADVNFVLDYYRLSADHRMLFGGRVSYSTLQPPNLERSMRPRMLKVFPQLGDVRIDYAWGGFVAITMNRAPHFGRLSDNVYFAQGFSGHGIALTGLAGKLIAEAIAGTAERFDVFARIPHRAFPGGRVLRTPMLVLAMAYYRLRDLL